jgi:hypothetical protein
MIASQLFLEEVEEWGKQRSSDESLDVVVGWDARAKAKLVVEDKQLDYGYTITLPNRAADCVLQETSRGSCYFVDYLRLAFRWGGFPGWEHADNRPESELALLADGLLQI